eukprot:TRINITY_DN33209_c0_g1_i1.p1 TRINITY_DN33209_c0_g1~~TRINITY_DN33209_c0_g1_i1.p1  ORF type:complete len:295 (-),score=61.47 TRINITY_DN33209_c0_g1_i1:172-1056(-)
MQGYTASQRQTRLQQKSKRINSRKADPPASESTWPSKVASTDLAALRQRGQELLAKMSQRHSHSSMTQNMHGTLGGNVGDHLWDYSPHSSLYVKPDDDIPSLLSSCPVQQSKVPRVIEPPNSCSAALLALRAQGQNTLTAISPLLAAKTAKVAGGSEVCTGPRTLSADLWVEEPGQDDLNIFSSQQDWQHSVLATIPSRLPPGLDAPVIPDVGTEQPLGLAPPPGLQPSTVAASDIPQLSGYKPSTAAAHRVEPSRVAPTLLQSLKHRNCKKVASEMEPLKVDLDCLSSLSVVS